jgi:hypothetical protein
MTLKNVSPDGSVLVIPAWTSQNGTNLDDGSGASEGIGGVTVSGTPSTGQVLTATSSTAADWQNSASGFSNPMTTLGDLIVEDATPTSNRLAGNTSATKKFLTQAGNGTISAIPAWGTITTGDVPTLNQNTTGTAAGLSTALAIASGGTGATSASSALANLGAAPIAGAQFSGAIYTTLTTLTFGSSIAVNAALGNAFAVTLTASTGTMATPTNLEDTQILRIRVIQGTGGGFTLAYSSGYDFGAAGVPTLSTAPGAIDILGFEYVASILKLCYIGSGLGF